MRPFLIHPTHRKYIRLLRNRAVGGNPIVLTNQDVEDFRKLMKTSKQRLYRHHGLYRITLRAMSRPQSDVTTEEIHSILDEDAINHIARFLSKAERSQLGTTLFSTFVVPILRRIIRRINRRELKLASKEHNYG